MKIDPEAAWSLHNAIVVERMEYLRRSKEYRKS